MSTLTTFLHIPSFLKTEKACESGLVARPAFSSESDIWEVAIVLQVLCLYVECYIEMKLWKSWCRDPFLQVWDIREFARKLKRMVMGNKWDEVCSCFNCEWMARLIVTSWSDLQPLQSSPFCTGKKLGMWRWWLNNEVYLVWAQTWSVEVIIFC